MNKIKAEYIWMDGHKPTQKLRSKTKVMNGPVNNLTQLSVTECFLSCIVGPPAGQRINVSD